MRRRGEQTEDEWEQLQRADKNEMQILTFHTVAVLSLLPLRCPSRRRMSLEQKNQRTYVPL